MFGPVRSPSNEYEPGTIEHHHACARSIRQQFMGRH
jgi:hypothetical protein